MSTRCLDAARLVCLPSELVGNAARLANPLAKVAEDPEGADDESATIPPAFLVGATGFEPATPTVST
jgi:hypothetical protein